jgi:hypothetical protein
VITEVRIFPEVNFNSTSKSEWDLDQLRLHIRGTMKANVFNKFLLSANYAAGTVLRFI